MRTGLSPRLACFGRVLQAFVPAAKLQSRTGEVSEKNILLTGPPLGFGRRDGLLVSFAAETLPARDTLVPKQISLLTGHSNISNVHV